MRYFMMSNANETTNSRPYETAAIPAATSGWACRHCGRFCGSGDNGKAAASYCCCTDRECKTEGCSNRAHKHYITCETCRDAGRLAKFQSLEKRDYGGADFSAYCVAEFDGDEFYFDEDSFSEHLAELLDEACGGLGFASDTEIAEAVDAVSSYRFVFAKCQPPTWRTSVSEILGDDLAHDQEWDTSEIDSQIAEWVEKNAPKVYWPTNVRVSEESLAEMLWAIVRER